MRNVTLQNAIMKGPLLFIILAISTIIFAIILGVSLWRGGTYTPQRPLPPPVEKPLTEEERVEVLTDMLHTNGTTESLSNEEEQQLYRALNTSRKERGEMTKSDQQRLLNALNGI